MFYCLPVFHTMINYVEMYNIFSNNFASHLEFALRIPIDASFMAKYSPLTNGRGVDVYLK